MKTIIFFHWEKWAMFKLEMYIEDIYSFAVNAINIFECNENIGIFTSAKHV